MLKTSLEKALQCLDQSADGESASRPVWEVGRLLASLKMPADSELPQMGEQALDLAAKLDELSYQLGRYLGKFEFNESELEQAQERLAGYQALFRKLGVQDVLALVAEAERIDAELTFIDEAALLVHKQLQVLVGLSKTLQESAKRLTAQRLKAAKSIKKRIEAELGDLAMLGATLDTEFTSVTRTLVDLDLSIMGSESQELWAKIAEVLSGVSDNGADKVQFLLSANPGEPAHPLHRVASGGEVSRIMLALKRALAADAETCVLVFDEIDTGISGKVADIVGRKLKELAAHFQVICISHLPQVAAYAHAHFLVHKHERRSRTESMITRLSSQASATEIARLLSGPEVTASSLTHAQTLIERAQML